MNLWENFETPVFIRIVHVGHFVVVAGPAPDAFTNKIYEHSRNLSNYVFVPDLDVKLDQISVQKFVVNGKDYEVEIIDSVEDYLTLMKELFDFDSIRGLIRGGFRVLFDSLHGGEFFFFERTALCCKPPDGFFAVTGPYVRRIFVDELCACREDATNADPLPDFGGEHPDPNLTYAHKLVEKMKEGVHDFGAAFDGDGVSD